MGAGAHRRRGILQHCRFLRPYLARRQTADGLGRRRHHYPMNGEGPWAGALALVEDRARLLPDGAVALAHEGREVNDARP